MRHLPRAAEGVQEEAQGFRGREVEDQVAVRQSLLDHPGGAVLALQGDQHPVTPFMEEGHQAMQGRREAPIQFLCRFLCQLHLPGDMVTFQDLPMDFTLQEGDFLHFGSGSLCLLPSLWCST